MTTKTLSARVRADGLDVDVVTLSLTEALSRVTRAELEVASGAPLDPGGLAGAPVAIELLLDGAVTRSWSLIAGEAAFLRVTSGSYRYALRLFAPFWLLQHTKNTRKFRNQSAVDIITSVLSQAGIAHRWRLTRTPPIRKYCVQYAESNFDFVSRLLEAEGIHYVVSGDGTLELDDDSTAAPPVEGATQFSLLEHAAALEAGEMGIFDFGWGARVRPGKVTVADYNWKKPRVMLRESAAADTDSELERYHYPAGFRKPADGAYLARIGLEAARAGAEFARGAANVVHFGPGRRLGFEGTELLLVEVRHEVRDPAFFDASEALSYRNRFEAIPSSVRYRPPANTPRPTIQGCHTATVRGPVGEEIHTDAYGRFRAQFHWDREAKGTDEDSRWLRKLQEPTSSVNLARVGWEVSVVYVDGDPDRPIGLARNINGKMVPSYGQPANKEVMTIKTPTYPGGEGFNELELDDRAGAQQLGWHAERDLRIQVNHDKTERVGRDETRVVEVQLLHEVMNDQKVRIGNDQTITVAKDQRVVIENDRNVTIAGNERVSSDGTIDITVGASSRETVGSLRFSLVGQIAPPKIDAKSLIPDPKSAGKDAARAALSSLRGGGGASGAAGALTSSLKGSLPTPGGVAGKLTDGGLSSLASGSIDRSGTKRLSRTVGGVHIAAALEPISTSSARLSAETIGGAKITVAGKAVQQSAGKALFHTVGGAIFRKSKGDMSYGSETSLVQVGGAATLAADDNVEINGDELTFSASEKLTLSSGDLAITLEPDKIHISGPLRIESGSKVIVKGNKDDLTKAAE